jgi:hypothetical protein
VTEKRRAEIEVWYLATLCEAASTGPAQALAAFGDAWQRLRAESLALASTIPEERLNREGQLSGVPDWTPRQLLERIAAHDDEHTVQVDAAIRDNGRATAR